MLSHRCRRPCLDQDRNTASRWSLYIRNGLLRHLLPFPFLQEATMLVTLAVILIVLWALGLLGGYAAGGLLHILLVIALIVIILRVLSGRRVL